MFEECLAKTELSVRQDRLDMKHDLVLGIQLNFVLGGPAYNYDLVFGRQALHKV